MSNPAEIERGVYTSIDLIRQGQLAIVQAENDCAQGWEVLTYALQGANDTAMMETVERAVAKTSFSAIYEHLGGAILGCEAYLHKIAPPLPAPPGAERLQQQGVILAKDNLNPERPTHLFRSNNIKDTGIYVGTAEGGALGLIADDGAIGFVKSSLSPTPDAVLEYVSVEAKSRGQGHGAYLIAAFAREVRLRGARAMTSFAINHQSIGAHVGAFGAENITFDPIKGPATPEVGTPQYENWLLTYQGALNLRIKLTDPAVHERLFTQ